MSPKQGTLADTTGARELLLKNGFGGAKIAVILGSGLGRFAEQIFDKKTVSRSTLPGFPQTTVPGHAGNIHFGRVRKEGRVSPPLLVFDGRIHLYESGAPTSAQAIPYLCRDLGVSTLIVTSAAGGFGKEILKGDLMVHTDILSLPGKYHPGIFGSMRENSPFYDKELIRRMEAAALQCGVALKKGVYCWVTGPSYETPAEVRALRELGGDAVGMSTLPEVAAARNSGMRVLGISLISNLASGLSTSQLTHLDVTATAEIASKHFISLLVTFLVSMD